MGFFTNDAAVVTVPAMPGEPAHYAGEEEVRRFVRFLLPGFHVESWNNRVVLNSGISDFKIVSDGLRQRGVDAAQGVAEVVFKGDRIGLFHVVFAPETAAKFRAAKREFGR